MSERLPSSVVRRTSVLLFFLGFLLPETASASPQTYECPVGEDGRLAFINTEGARFREGPSTSESILGELSHNTPLIIIEVEEEGGLVSIGGNRGREWYRVRLVEDCREGWVYSGLVIDPSEESFAQTPLLAEGCNDVVAVGTVFGERIDNPEVINALYSLKGRPLIWLGYPKEGEEPEWGVKHGTDLMPEDLVEFIEAFTADGGLKYYVLFYRHEGDRYSAWVVNSELTTDANGNWLGNHPPPGCSPVELLAGDVTQFLDLIR